MEIERKFLLQALPRGAEGCRRAEFRQTYLSVGNGNSPERRIRCMTDGGITRYILTEKGDGTLIREESEREISREEYEELHAIAVTADIEKTRIFMPLSDGLTAEIDIYGGALEGLMTVEVEFDSSDAAVGFVPPRWFGDEITEDKSYKNRALAMFGMKKQK